MQAELVNVEYVIETTGHVLETGRMLDYSANGRALVLSEYYDVPIKVYITTDTKEYDYVIDHRDYPVFE